MAKAKPTDEAPSVKVPSATYRELSVQINGPQAYQRTLLVRQLGAEPSTHSGEILSLPLDRCLEVVGIPCRWGCLSLADCFRQFGAVEKAVVSDISTQRKPSLGPSPGQAERGPPRISYVLFSSPLGLKKALKAGAPAGGPRRPKPIPEAAAELASDAQAGTRGVTSGVEGDEEDGTAVWPEFGLQKWLGEYRAQRPGRAALQSEVDRFMADHDAREEQAKRDREVRAAEEGWTVVVGKAGRKKTTDPSSGVSVGAVAKGVAERNAKKGHRQQQAFDFYRFQHREARRNELLELQQRFEEDKKRIAKLKAGRKFRPY